MEIKVEAISITNEILNAADTSQIVPLFGMPARSYILFVTGRVRTAFAGVTGPTMTIGYTGGTSDIMKSQDLTRASDLMAGPNQDTKQFCPRLNAVPIVTEASKQIFATFATTSGNWSALTTGNVEIVIVYVA